MEFDDQLLDSIHIGLITHNKNREVEYCNTEACKLLGVSEEVIRTSQIHTFGLSLYNISKNEINIDDHPVTKALQAKQSVKNQMIGRKNEDDEFIWINVNVYPELDEKGNICRIVSSYTDVTKIVKDGEKEAESSSISYQVILNTLREGVAYAKLNGTIDFVNDALVEMIGVPKEELVGKNGLLVVSY